MFSENGQDYSLTSWWPTDSIWQSNAQHTRWTKKEDKWFVTWLLKICQGQQGPLNAEGWRKQIRGSSTLRRINKFVTETFDRFVDAEVTA